MHVRHRRHERAAQRARRRPPPRRRDGGDRAGVVDVDRRRRRAQPLRQQRMPREQALASCRGRPASMRGDEHAPHRRARPAGPSRASRVAWTNASAVAFDRAQVPGRRRAPRSAPARGIADAKGRGRRRMSTVAPTAMATAPTAARRTITLKSAPLPPAACIQCAIAAVNVSTRECRAASSIGARPRRRGAARRRRAAPACASTPGKRENGPSRATSRHSRASETPSSPASAGRSRSRASRRRRCATACATARRRGRSRTARAMVATARHCTCADGPR